MSQDISLHKIEHERDGHVTVRVAVPHYDRDDPTREISAGWFMGDPRGILVRARPDDLRSIARVLIEAAESLV